MNDTPTPREVQMPLLGRAMGYAAGLKDCHDCFADRAAIVLYDALTDVTEQRDDLQMQLDSSCNAEELRQFRAERDRLAEEVGQLKSRLTQTQGAVTISRNGYVQELEQQRDRLAEVMAKILNTPMNHTRRELLLEQALQSLTPKL